MTAATAAKVAIVIVISVFIALDLLARARRHDRSADELGLLEDEETA